MPPSASAPSNRCIHCMFCSMWDATCTHPMLGFKHINYDHPACEYFESEIP